MGILANVVPILGLAWARFCLDPSLGALTGVVNQAQPMRVVID
jgi:hypothetical protein